MRVFNTLKTHCGQLNAMVAVLTRLVAQLEHQDVLSRVGMGESI
jgi:hypothetical protein